jgi:hypothetical protein
VASNENSDGNDSDGKGDDIDGENEVSIEAQCDKKKKQVL